MGYKFKSPIRFHSIKSSGCQIPVRYGVVVLGFLGLSCAYSMQVALNVTVLAMSRYNLTRNGSKGYVECANLVDPSPKTKYTNWKGGRYDWGSKEQGLILTSFYYGYLLTQLPGGYLAEICSPKWLFGSGILLSGLLTLLIPIAAAAGTGVLIGFRVVQGLCQGLAKPAINVIITRWAPKLERSRFSTLIFSGGLIGSIITMPLAGVISSSDTLGGWPTVFTLFGTVSCLWFALWIFFFYDDPTEHPRITTSEIDLLFKQKEETARKTTKVPWKAIFSSLPVWSIIVSHVGSSFSFYILFIEFPNYLENVLHFDIQEDGFLSALPYIVQIFSAALASCLADKLRELERLSITNIRKIFNSIGLIGPALCMLCITLSGCSAKWVVGLICLAAALNGFVYSGFEITHIDMSPQYAGTLFGICNTFATTTAIIGPSLVSVLIADGETLAKWNDVFYIMATLYVMAAVFFNTFASADVQEWSVEQKHKHPSDVQYLLNQ